MNPGVFFMMINSETIFSMTQANQNFSQVARSVDQNGKAVIFKNNKPKYIVMEAQTADTMLELTDDEMIDITASRVLKRYLPAFRELAK